MTNTAADYLTTEKRRLEAISKQSQKLVEVDDLLETALNRLNDMDRADYRAAKASGPSWWRRLIRPHR
jgi:hypothetical protein